MIKSIYKILPVFIYIWIVRKLEPEIVCKAFKDHDYGVWYWADKDVLIRKR